MKLRDIYIYVIHFYLAIVHFKFVLLDISASGKCLHLFQLTTFYITLMSCIQLCFLIIITKTNLKKFTV